MHINIDVLMGSFEKTAMKKQIVSQLDKEMPDRGTNKLTITDYNFAKKLQFMNCKISVLLGSVFSETLKTHAIQLLGV